MKVTRALTIGVRNLKEETIQILGEYAEIYGKNIPDVYKKKKEGFFIDVPEEFDAKLYKGAPQDLLDAMYLAFAYGCRWLCVDKNTKETDELAIY